MTFLLVILLAVGLAVGAAAAYGIFLRLKGVDDRLGQSLSKMEQRFENVDNRLNTTLSETSATMKNIGQELAGMRNSTQQILEVGKGISSLQDILRPPKMRGGFGEMLLGRLLEQILPRPNFTLQHRFRNGETVDAVIDLGTGLVPVDSKFPLENFRGMLEAETEEERRRRNSAFVRDVKKHINDVAKYIRPDEGTLEFALMYIPAENVYYEIIGKGEQEIEGKSAQEFAIGRRVFPVSPNSFYGYLMSILLGLRGLQVEKRAQEILGHLGRLKGDFEAFHKDFVTLGSHLNNAQNKYTEVNTSMQRYGDRLSVSLDAEAPSTSLIEK